MILGMEIERIKYLEKEKRAIVYTFEDWCIHDMDYASGRACRRPFCACENFKTILMGFDQVFDAVMGIRNMRISPDRK